MKYYAIVIQKIERELGIKVVFPSLVLSLFNFSRSTSGRIPILPNKNTWNSLRYYFPFPFSLKSVFISGNSDKETEQLPHFIDYNKTTPTLSTCYRQTKVTEPLS